MRVTSLRGTRTHSPAGNWAARFRIQDLDGGNRRQLRVRLIRLFARNAKGMHMAFDQSGYDRLSRQPDDPGLFTDVWPDLPVRADRHHVPVAEWPVPGRSVLSYPGSEFCRRAGPCPPRPGALVFPPFRQARWQAAPPGRTRQSRAQDGCRRLLGGEHPDTLMATNSLAETLQSQGGLAGARQFQEQVIEAHTMYPHAPLNRKLQSRQGARSVRRPCRFWPLRSVSVRVPHHLSNRGTSARCLRGGDRCQW